MKKSIKSKRPQVAAFIPPMMPIFSQMTGVKVLSTMFVFKDGHQEGYGHEFHNLASYDVALNRAQKFFDRHRNELKFCEVIIEG